MILMEDLTRTNGLVSNQTEVQRLVVSPKKGYANGGRCKNLEEDHCKRSSSTREPNVSLLDKFDGTRSRLRGFINQIRLIIHLQPRCYSDDFRRVRLIGTLLTGQAQAWFVPLVETSSPLLTDFQAFLTEFEATFRETDKRRAALNKLYVLQQGECATSIYASEFR